MHERVVPTDVPVIQCVVSVVSSLIAAEISTVVGYARGAQKMLTLEFPLGHSSSSSLIAAEISTVFGNAKEVHKRCSSSRSDSSHGPS